MAAILIVEDEPFISEVAQMIIDDMGHTSVIASTLDDALKALRSSEPFDALFTDIRLDSVALAGYDIARQAIKLRPPIRVLYTSGSPVTEKTKALFVRSARFVQKPYSQPQLEDAIRDLLAASEPQTRPAPSP
jgi:DNA-binding NtrC family response regulator